MNTTETAQQTCDLMAAVLAELVLNKPALAVTFTMSTEEQPHVRVTLRNDPPDSGRIIGGKGLHFRSLQAFANVVGLKHDMLFDITPLPLKGARELKRHDEFRGLDVWREKDVLALLVKLVGATVEHDDVVKIETEDLPSFTTKLTVHVARLESSAIIRTMTFGILTPDGTQTGWLRVLANAIGKANGRTLMLEVVADQDAEDRQPKGIVNGSEPASNLSPVRAGQRRRVPR